MHPVVFEGRGREKGRVEGVAVEGWRGGPPLQRAELRRGKGPREGQSDQDEEKGRGKGQSKRAELGRGEWGWPVV